MLTTETSVRPARPVAIGRHLLTIMLAAFTLSVVHTVYSWLGGLENPAFTVTTPLTWTFYGVAFAVSALALRPERWSQWTVTAFLVAVILIGVFYYPTTFEPRQQTTFGWFENDVYLGLLGVALYLALQRLRGVELVRAPDPTR